MIDKIKIDIQLYRDLMNSQEDVAGDFAEFGVWRGDTFQHIYSIGLSGSRNVHAFDSFIGMPPPVLDNDCEYHEGLFSIGGSPEFKKKFPEAIIHEGFIPGTLDAKDYKFAFAHIDLDHEHSTRLTLDWLWPRMSNGGIMICHDYWPDASKLAGKAINDWMRDNSINGAGVQNYSIWFIK